MWAAQHVRMGNWGGPLRVRSSDSAIVCSSTQKSLVRFSPNFNHEPRQIHEKNPRIPRGPRSKNLSSKLNVLSSPNEKREPREAA